MNEDVKEFYQWRREKGLSDSDEDFVTVITMTLSTIKYKDNVNMLSEAKNKKLRDNIKKLWEKCQSDWPKASLPDYDEIKDITLAKYESIIKSGVETDFSVKELLYSLHKQGLCAQFVVDLLKTASQRNKIR
ncbi:hypothetical protein ACFVL4_17905 [Bacillus subtilis]|uniref:Uncharacterized protein n=1 Tax=Bacillus subtilis TaxID=1423 RepID=A0A0D1KMJ7_BACIU|nr:hypothetical protein [Bacillus subtilis]KIU04401.1 hypothetical protein SC09_contig8orf00032 [Bacillus subtilis]MCB4338735.1 hypothetical protein [Bacillus subtilis]MDK7656988.1 hypothetical protein [Bacillus subtilis]